MKEVLLHTARNGSTIAYLKGVRLQSPYDPQKEAEKFIHIHTSGTVPNTIIFSGCSLGYLPLAARKMFPQTKIIALFLTKFFYEQSRNILHKKNILTWSQKSHGPLTSFLFEHLFESDIPHLLFLSWPAAEEALPKHFKNISSVVKSIIQQHNGSLKTTQAFGKRWIKNVLSNYIIIKAYARLSTIKRPILVTASGPSLNDTLPLLIPHRKKICLIALPSSLKVLQHFSIYPDFVITTDPGFWAGQHLYYLHPSSVLIAPLSAHLNHFNNDNPITVISDGVPGEKDCIRHEKLPYISLPPNGTVAGTALEFSFYYTNNSIFFLGFDLSVRDIQGHVIPHPFDLHLFLSSYRYHPLQTEYFVRALLFYPNRMKVKYYRTSKSLETYANWFSMNSNRWKKRIFRVGFSPVSLPNIPFISNKEFTDILSDIPEPTSLRQNFKEEWSFFQLSSNRNQRTEFVISLIDSWIKKIEDEKNALSDKEQYLPIDPIVKELFKYILTQDYIDSKNLLLVRGRKKWEDHFFSTLSRLKMELTSLRSMITDV